MAEKKADTTGALDRNEVLKQIQSISPMPVSPDKDDLLWCEWAVSVYRRRSTHPWLTWLMLIDLTSHVGSTRFVPVFRKIDAEEKGKDAAEFKRMEFSTQRGIHPTVSDDGKVITLDVTTSLLKMLDPREEHGDHVTVYAMSLAMPELKPDDTTSVYHYEVKLAEIDIDTATAKWRLTVRKQEDDPAFHVS